MRKDDAETGSIADRLADAFAAYNRKDADALLAMVTDDVSWWTDGGTRQGKGSLRTYWMQQWGRIDTQDEVLGVERTPDGRFVVSLAQVVRSLDGIVISKGEFDYEFEMRGVLIARLGSMRATPRS